MQKFEGVHVLVCECVCVCVCVCVCKCVCVVKSWRVCDGKIMRFIAFVYCLLIFLGFRLIVQVAYMCVCVSACVCVCRCV